MMDKTAILVGDRFWQGGTNFGCQNWSGGPVLVGFSAKIGPAGPILGGTDFGVTDRLVFGINDEAIQRRLLAETTLTLKKAFELALKEWSLQRRMFAKCRGMFKQQ